MVMLDKLEEERASVIMITSSKVVSRAKLFDHATDWSSRTVYFVYSASTCLHDRLAIII